MGMRAKMVVLGADGNWRCSRCRAPPVLLAALCRHCKDRAGLLHELHSVRARHEGLLAQLGRTQQQEDRADAMARR